MLPPLPDARRLADACRRTAATERVAAATVEKDFYLTRLIWALAENQGERLLLKGGTCLSKVDLGYHRMSEDADFVVPYDGDLRYKTVNVAHINRVREALRRVAPEVGLDFSNPNPVILTEHRSHAKWELPYPSDFGPQAIAVEVSLRRQLREPRRTALRQLLGGPLEEGYEAAYCWALDADEVRAEKVRAAYTREHRAIRDFYDLRLLADAGFDMASPAFLALVDQKLEEVPTPSLSEQPPGFGLTADQRADLEADIDLVLAPVLRRDEPRLDLAGVIAHYDRLWGRTS